MLWGAAPSEFEITLVRDHTPLSTTVKVTNLDNHAVGELISSDGFKLEEARQTLQILLTQAPFRNILSVLHPDSLEAGIESWTINTEVNITIDVPYSYWIEAMSRGEEWVKVTRLTSILKGFYLEHCLCLNITPSRQGAIDFTYSKRPYGNKDVPASICFNLGWDWAGVLGSTGVHELVQTEAWRLHELVVKQLTEELTQEEETIS